MQVFSHMRIALPRAGLTFALNSVFCVTASRLPAQTSGKTSTQHAHHAAVGDISRSQIDTVVRAMAPFATRAAAAAAGFQPRFGWIPTMGEHWVSIPQMTTMGRQTNRAKPSQLLYSKIDGRDSLVGAAYAYMTATNDTVRPVLFDGNPPWHEHQDLAPEGLTLVMLHVWFVPSPDGPFAGTNPNLPFWAAGLAAPNASRMRDTAFASIVRRASLALGEVADTGSIFPRLKLRPEVGPAIAARRDTVRGLIPQLLAAQRARDAARWDRAARRAAAQWDGMYQTYLASARTSDGRQRIERFVALLLGQHAE